MRLKNKILLSLLIFMFCYPSYLIVWIKIKSYYSYGLTHVGAYLAASTMESAIKRINIDKEDAKITFIRPFYEGSKRADIIIDVIVSVSHYSFNAPLSLALITALFPLFRWKRRSIVEVVLLLILVHLLYIYSFCCLQQYYIFSRAGIEARSTFGQLFWEFLWSFTDNMIIRFEPFLVVIYLWFLNQKFLWRQRAYR